LIGQDKQTTFEFCMVMLEVYDTFFQKKNEEYGLSTHIFLFNFVSINNKNDVSYTR